MPKEQPLEYLQDIPITQTPKELAASSQPTGTTTQTSINTITNNIIERIIEQPQIINQIVEIRDYPKSVELSDLKVGNQNLVVRATTDGLWAGAIDPDSAPFRVTMGGAITTTNITVTGGTIGGWTINTTSIADNATAASAKVLIDSTNTLIRLGPTTGDYISLLGASQIIRSSNYVAGVSGSGFSIDPTLIEGGDIRARVKLSSATFEIEAISAIAGSQIMTWGSDVLDQDMTALDTSTLKITGDKTFVVGDVLRMKTKNDDEWLTVTGTTALNTYTVTRDRDSDYSANANPTWQKGTTVVNYGQSGQGTIFSTASEPYSPRISILTHAGSPWDTESERLRMGNLNTYFPDINTDVYGFAVGDSDDYMRAYHDGTSQYFKLALTSANSIAEMEVGTGGYIRAGQTAYATGTGWWLGNAGGENKASIGDATQYLKYAGGELELSGAFIAQYPIQLKTYATGSLPTPIGNTGVHPFTSIT